MAEICCNLVETKNKDSSSCGETNPRVARRRRMEFRRMRVLSGPETMAPVERSRQKRRRPDGLSSKQRFREKSSPDNVLEDVRRSGSSSDEQGRGSGLGSDFDSDSSGGKRSCESMGNFDVSYGVTSVCGRRREMEDTVSIHMDLVGNYHFFGVFDGHGCSHVATLCKERMHAIITSEVKQRQISNQTLKDNQWREAMHGGFSEMDREAIAAGTSNKEADGEPRVPNCSCGMRTPRCDHVGSTAVVAVVGRTNLIVASCGDSRAVLCRNGSAIPLSSDHKPDRPDELQRIQQAGGRVIYWDGARVFGVLAMSRAIGDGYLKPYVISEPEVTISERNEEDECLIIASDGLWDVVSNEMACEIVSRCLKRMAVPNGDDGESEEQKKRKMKTEMDKACGDATVLLTKLALARQSSDNVSVVVINLKHGNL